MKKFTLLEIVVKTLDSMDSDTVTDIDDTDESAQVASIAEDVFFNMTTKKDWKHLKTVTQLTELTDANHPTHFTLTDGLENVEVIKYNVKTDAADADDYQEIRFIKEPSEFLELVHSRNSTDSEVDTISDFGGADIYVYNDRVPSCWTTFDDDYIIFDAYLATLDATLPASKTVVVSIKAPTWTRGNNDIPPMPGRMFPAFMERVKAVAHADLLKQRSAVHENEAVSQMTTITTKSTKTKNPNGINRKPNYSRK